MSFYREHSVSVCGMSSEFKTAKLLYSLDDLRNNTIRDKLNSNWEHFAPIAFLYERDTPLSQRASAVLRREYLGDGPIENPKSLQGLGRIYSDALIGVAYHRFVRLMAAHTPIYTYLFRYKGRYSFLKNPDNNQTLGTNRAKLVERIY